MRGNLDLALDFELVTRVEALCGFWVADVDAVFGARLHHQLRDVVFLVEQQLGSSIRHNVVDRRAIGRPVGRRLNNRKAATAKGCVQNLVAFLRQARHRACRFD